MGPGEATGKESRVLPRSPRVAPRPPCPAPSLPSPWPGARKEHRPGHTWTWCQSPALKPAPGFIYRGLSFQICEVGMILAPATWHCLLGINNKQWKHFSHKNKKTMMVPHPPPPSRSVRPTSHSQRVHPQTLRGLGEEAHVFIVTSSGTSSQGSDPPPIGTGTPHQC